MKKIAIISTSYYPNIWNGQGRSTFATAYGLAKKGYDVSVFTYTNKEETCKKQDGQVTVHYIGGVSDISVSSMPFSDIAIWNERLLPLLLCEKFDTIILNNWHGFEAAKKYKTAKIVSIIPFLYTFTGWLKPLGFALEQEIKVREADCILESDVLISHTYQFGRRLSDYSNREVIVVPNCYLDLSNTLVTKTVVTKNQICSVGRVNREKSIERIIRVMPDIQEITLVVASPESSQAYFGSLSRLAKKMDVENRVSFVGWKNTKDTRELYKQSAMAIVPSQFEPFGYGALDAMSLGVPIIASEWSCLEEYIGSKETIFNSLDSLKEMIIKQINMLASDIDAMTSKNKQRCFEDFSEESVTSLLVQVL